MTTAASVKKVQPIYQRHVTLTNHGSANLTIEANGDTFLALNGKATRLRSGPHGDDLAKLAALLEEGMAVRVASERGEAVDLGID